MLLLQSDADFFANIIVEAATAVRFPRADDKSSFVYPIKNVHVLKALGQSTRQSVFIPGYALNCSLANQLMPKQLKTCRIACLDFSLQKVKMKLGVQVLITDPAKLEAIRQREADIAKERIQKIIAAGANVVLTTGGIDDMCAKYMVEAGVMGIRRVTKADLKKIAKSSGAQLLSTLSNLEGEESFEAAFLGEAEECSVERVGDNDCIFFRKFKHLNSASILLRGPNEYYLDEMERSFHDALCVVKAVMESKRVVPGGGAVEVALSIFLENFATSISSREQLAIAEFAKSLLVIPKTLAVNAAKDATDLVAKLRAYHNSSQTRPENGHYKWFGLDLADGKLRDSIKAGVLEPLQSKIKSLKFATEAAITILRIDDLIRIDPKEDPRKGRDQCGY